MPHPLPLALATLLLLPSFLPAQGDRLTRRRLGSIATIDAPARIRESMYGEDGRAEPSRVTFVFGTTYFWASFGSGPAYRQQLFVSVMASDASDADYARIPHHYSLSYDPSRVVHRAALGSGTLTVRHGVYRQNTLQEPSHLFFYEDRARRLQLVWHAVVKEVSLERGIALVEAMAKSFRLLRDPVAAYADERDRPRREAEEGARKVALVRATLAREGLADLATGKPVEKEGIWYEWTDDPEPRLQLYKPLGRVKATPNVMGGQRPRPASLRNADGSVRRLGGTVGWYEFWEGDWRSMNHENDYLPFPGLQAMLAAEHRDPAWVAFYFSASLRVELADDAHLSSLDWFRRAVPEVERLWREGALVRGAMDEAPFPIRRP